MPEISFNREVQKSKKLHDYNTSRLKTDPNPAEARKRRPKHRRYPTKWLGRCRQFFNEEGSMNVKTLGQLTQRAIELYSLGLPCEVAGRFLAMEYALYEEMLSLNHSIPTAFKEFHNQSQTQGR